MIVCACMGNYNFALEWVLTNLCYVPRLYVPSPANRTYVETGLPSCVGLILPLSSITWCLCDIIFNSIFRSHLTNVFGNNLLNHG